MHCLSLIRRQMSLSIIRTDVTPVGVALLGGANVITYITNSPASLEEMHEILAGTT